MYDSSAYPQTIFIINHYIINWKPLLGTILSLATYMSMVGHVNTRTDTHNYTHKLYGWPISAQAAHTHTGSLYVYGHPICI